MHQGTNRDVRSRFMFQQNNTDEQHMKVNIAANGGVQLFGYPAHCHLKQC